MSAGFILGFKAKLYYRLGGVTGGGGAFVELTNCTNVKPALEAGEADVTTRAANGFEEMAPSQFKFPIEFEMLVDPTDTGYADFKATFLARGVLGIRILDNDPGATPPGTGFQGDFAIFKFAADQSLEAAQKVSVTIKPTRGTTHVEEYP